MAELLIPPFWEFADNDGNPLSGGLVYTYAAGTLTPKATFTDSGGLTPNANPVVLDVAGRAVIWGSGSYKFIIRDSLGNTIRTVDNVTTYNTLANAVNPYFESFSGDGTQTVFTLSEDVGVDSENIYLWVADGLEAHVTNGDFATDSDWTKGAGWSIGSGVATATGAISTALSQTSAVTVLEGQSYNLTYTVTRSAGGIIPSIGGTNGTERTSSGTYKETIIAGSTQLLAFTGNAFTGTLDNITITPAVAGKYEIQNPSSYTVNGTSLTFSVAPPAGTNNIYVSSPSLLLGSASNAAAAAEASAVAAAAAQTAAELAETNAETAEANAETAEANAEAAATKLVGTSTTSLAIDTGEKIFTTQADKFFEAGNWLLITSDADIANYMHGQVTTYSGTTLTMNITNIGGSGTLADWTIRLSGTRGAVGAPGTVGDGDKGDITVTSSGAVWTIDDDVVTLANMAGGTDGNLITYDADGDPAYVATGTAAQVLTSNGEGAAPTFQDAAGGGGVIVSTAYAETSTQSTLTATIPVDNTIPQNTEGTEILTVTVTTTTATQRVRIVGVWWGQYSTSTNGFVTAVFVNSDADAIYANHAWIQSTNRGQPNPFVLEHAPASAASHTYKIRIGAGTGNIFFNRNAATANLFGGAVGKSTVVAEVIEP